ncbi:MAG: O-antigen ligase domain-containing protein [Bacteroidetes bacterium]|nr:MAG: O-antigen ligase domain-containing protein [Bacteroidota bacterium]
MNFNRLQQSNFLLYTGLMMLVAGLPLSLFLTSLSQFFIIGSFFIEGSIAKKFKKFLSNPSAVLITSLWLLHLLGLAWTDDLQEGFKDLRIKLPLLILPLVLSGSEPLSKKQFQCLLSVFIAAVFAGSLVSMAVYSGIIQREIHDIRDIFIFNISHIRFALFVCLSIFILIQKANSSWKAKEFSSFFFISILIIWFAAFLVFIESMTGLVLVLITGLVHLAIAGYRASRLWTRVLVILSVVLITSLLVFEIRNIIEEYNVKHEYEIDITEKTKKGNTYIFQKNQKLYENGYPIWVYVCDEELRADWNKLSSIPYDSLDERGQPLRFTLIRFLSSKGLRKDSEGLATLSEEEIKSVEKGIANVKYQNLSDARIRLIQIIWEFDQYRRGENPGGHSVTQRFEFWKAAIGIISSNPLIGVGTGDMPAAYQNEYVKTNSQLDEKYRLRAHNQYLAIGVGLGIPILIYFIFVLFYCFFKSGMWKDYLFLSFWLIATLSMLTEDTLETQSGVTFVVLFLSLFLFSQKREEKSEI